jgi:hypothetical protein
MLLPIVTPLAIASPLGSYSISFSISNMAQCALGLSNTSSQTSCHVGANDFWLHSTWLFVPWHITQKHDICQNWRSVESWLKTFFYLGTHINPKQWILNNMKLQQWLTTSLTTRFE